MIKVPIKGSPAWRAMVIKLEYDLGRKLTGTELKNLACMGYRQAGNKSDMVSPAQLSQESINHNKTRPEPRIGKVLYTGKYKPIPAKG